MSKNLSISNSSNPKRFFLFVVCSFLFIFWFSIFLYLICPKLFYWRAWEYFNEILYPKFYKNIPIWKWSEKGDLSRNFLFYYQDRWKTTVSADNEGFRSVPLKADQYPILVVGDSHTWGSGLNDEETLPWRLANQLKIPVFNGARLAFYLENLLAKKSFQETTLIIELVSTNHLKTTHLPEQFQIKNYQPYKERDSKRIHPIYQFKKQVSKFLKKDPRRYFLPYKVFHFISLKHICNSLFKAKHMNDYGIEKNEVPFSLNDEDFQVVVDRIEKRAKDIKQLGYEYVFIPVPPKPLICSDQLNLNSLEQFSKLTQELSRRGIHAIDLAMPFCNFADRKALYFRTDLHWGPEGTELASKIISEYLQNHFISAGLVLKEI